MIKLTPISTPLQFEQADMVADWKDTFASHGGLDIETGKFTPLKKVKQMLTDSDSAGVNYILDAIAGAVEFGSIELHEYTDFKKLFAKTNEIPGFVHALHAYGEEFWLNSRHFHAFFNNLIADEAACKSYQQVANWLAENAK